MNRQQNLISNGHEGKGSDDWLTPEWLYDFFRSYFDASPEIPEGMRTFDGMGDWKEFTWLNPPYSEPAVWVEKAIQEAEKGKKVIMLLKCDPSTQWYLKLHDYIYSNAKEPRGGIFTHVGRMKYRHEKNPPFASMLVFLNNCKVEVEPS